MWTTLYHTYHIKINYFLDNACGSTAMVPKQYVLGLQFPEAFTTSWEFQSKNMLVSQGWGPYMCMKL